MINNFVGIGRLTRDPELRRTETGKAVAMFTIAIDRGFDGEHTDFLPVVCWDKLAENVANFLSKGSLVAVQGSVTSRVYKTRDGQNRTAIEVLARTVQFLEKKKEDQSFTKSNAYSSFDEDIEF